MYRESSDIVGEFGAGKRRGFTLLEVMIAFTILAVGVLALAPLTVFMLKGNLNTKHLNQARLLAEQYAERVRALDYEDAFLADDGDTTDLSDVQTPDHSDTVVIDGQQYVVMWNIAKDLPMRGIKSVNIIVQWKSPIDDRTHRVNFLTYKAAVSR